MRALIIIILAVACSLINIPAYSCAYIDGYLLDESTVIVWDQQTHTEHFIRRATFEDIKGKSVGFIVPTPTVPQLAEADEDVFSGLENVTAPEIRKQVLQDYSLGSWLFPAWSLPIIKTPEPLPPDMDASAAPEMSVEVLQHQRIGDLDAVTLRATNAAALNQWLARHQFDSNPAFERWLDFYVQKNWVVTAFRFMGDKDTVSISSPLIRMSFKTDQPFYPYREPQTENTLSGRELRVYLLAAGKMQAAPSDSNKRWPGEVIWSDDLQQHPKQLKSFDPSLSKQLKLPESVIKQTRWMTVFEDLSASRKGAGDIIFIPAANENVLPHPIIEYERNEIRIPVEAIALFVIVIGVFVKMRRGKSDG